MIDKLMIYRAKWLNNTPQHKFSIINTIWGSVGSIGSTLLLFLVEKDLPQIKPIKLLITYTPIYSAFMIFVLLIYCLTLYYTNVHKKDIDNNLVTLFTNKHTELDKVYKYVLEIAATTASNTIILFIASIIYNSMYSSNLDYSNNFLAFFYVFIFAIFWAAFCMTLYDLLSMIFVVISCTIPQDIVKR